MKPLQTLIALFTLIVCCNCYTQAYSQNISYYTSPEDDAGKYKEWTTATEKQYQADVSALSGKNKKYLEEVYKERYESVKKNVR